MFAGSSIGGKRAVAGGNISHFRQRKTARAAQHLVVKEMMLFLSFEPPEIEHQSKQSRRYANKDGGWWSKGF